MKATPTQIANTELAYMRSHKPVTLRSELIGLLKHRKISLDKSKPFPGKAPMVAAAVQLLNRFENLSKVSDERLRDYIKDEAPRLMYLYGKFSNHPKQHQRILKIVADALI